MTFETMVKIILGELKTPESQAWVTIEDLKKMAEKLDGNSE